MTAPVNVLPDLRDGGFRADAGAGVGAGAWHAGGQGAARDPWAIWRRLVVDALAVLAILVHTGTLVAFPQKLAGGGAVPWTGYVWAGGALLSFVMVALGPWRVARAAATAWPILALTVWAAASLTWSVAPYETLRGVVYLAATHALAFTLAACFSWRRLITLVAVTLGGLVTASVAVAVLAPGLGRMTEIHPGAWSGLWGEKQTMSIQAGVALAASVGLFALGRWRALAAVFALVAVVAVIGTTGRTAILMSGLGVAVALWAWTMAQDRSLAVLATWSALLAGAGVAALFAGGAEWLLALLGRGSDLTGRTEVWNAVRDLSAVRPNEGWGFAAIWRGQDEMTAPMQWVMDKTGFTPANAHNSWLDAQVALGFVGLALLVVAMAWTWLNLIARLWTRGRHVAFAAGVLAVISFICFTETVLLTAMDLQWLLVVTIGTKLALGKAGLMDDDLPAPRRPRLEDDGAVWVHDAR
jgi:O-antigen ligase